MNQHDFDRFNALIQGVAECYGQTLSAQGIALRFRMLEAFEYSDVERAALSIMASRTYTSMPTPADFLERLGGGSLDDRAEVEADKVFEAMSSVGGYRSVAFDDPVTQAVIRNAYGGWPQLCRDCQERERKWWRRDFIKTYSAYARQGVRLFGHLPGAAEIGNAAAGYGVDTERPVPIGNASGADSVLLGMPPMARDKETPPCTGLRP